MFTEEEKKETYKEVEKLVTSLNDDISEFKQYVMGFLFYRYISEDFENYMNAYEQQGDSSFQYHLEKDEDWEDEGTERDLIKAKGLFIKPSHLFKNVLQETEEKCEFLNEKLRQVFEGIEESSKKVEEGSRFSGLFGDISLNSEKLGKEVKNRNEKLREIMRKIQKINLGKVGKEGENIFSDVYSFLMGMYAEKAGKKGGESYTPPEVSELMVKLAISENREVESIYDPACGSGSLLLKYPKITGNKNVEICGQEKEFATYNLCRMNFLINGIEYNKFDIQREDTLLNPQHINKRFQIVVSNPPYSAPWKGEDHPGMINDSRFNVAGVLAPKSKADFAFIMHCLYQTAENGIAVVVAFPGTLYRGAGEQKIRKYLVDNNYIDCVIQLAENFFYGTAIAVCIMILKKSKPENKTLFIDASKQLEKIKNKNRLSQENIQYIVDIYKQRKDIDYISKLVDNTEIAEQDYNLSVTTYVEKEDTREKIDINALNEELRVIRKNTDRLRDEIEEIIRELESDE